MLYYINFAFMLWFLLLCVVNIWKLDGMNWSFFSYVVITVVFSGIAIVLFYRHAGWWVKLAESVVFVMLLVLLTYTAIVFRSWYRVFLVGSFTVFMLLLLAIIPIIG